MNKFNGLNNSIFAQMAFCALPRYKHIAEENCRWEQRQNKWEAKWANSKDPSELYRKLADVAIAYGFNDLSNVQPWFFNEKRGRLSLKKVAESLVGHRLPDINPKKCFEFAKETPISAENWYRGCSDSYD